MQYKKTYNILCEQSENRIKTTDLDNVREKIVHSISFGREDNECFCYDTSYKQDAVSTDGSQTSYTSCDTFFTVEDDHESHTNVTESLNRALNEISKRAMYFFSSVIGAGGDNVNVRNNATYDNINWPSNIVKQSFSRRKEDNTTDCSSYNEGSVSLPETPPNRIEWCMRWLSDQCHLNMDHVLQPEDHKQDGLTSDRKAIRHNYSDTSMRSCNTDTSQCSQGSSEYGVESFRRAQSYSKNCPREESEPQDNHSLKMRHERHSAFIAATHATTSEPTRTNSKQHRYSQVSFTEGQTPICTTSNQISIPRPILKKKDGHVQTNECRGTYDNMARETHPEIEVTECNLVRELHSSSPQYTNNNPANKTKNSQKSDMVLPDSILRETKLIPYTYPIPKSLREIKIGQHCQSHYKEPGQTIPLNKYCTYTKDRETHLFANNSRHNGASDDNCPPQWKIRTAVQAEKPTLSQCGQQAIATNPILSSQHRERRAKIKHNNRRRGQECTRRNTTKSVREIHPPNVDTNYTSSHISSNDAKRKRVLRSRNTPGSVPQTNKNVCETRPNNTNKSGHNFRNAAPKHRQQHVTGTTATTATTENQKGEANQQNEHKQPVTYTAKRSQPETIVAQSALSKCTRRHINQWVAAKSIGTDKCETRPPNIRQASPVAIFIDRKGRISQIPAISNKTPVNRPTEKRQAGDIYIDNSGFVHRVAEFESSQQTVPATLTPFSGEKSNRSLKCDRQCHAHANTAEHAVQTEVCEKLAGKSSFENHNKTKTKKEICAETVAAVCPVFPSKPPETCAERKQDIDTRNIRFTTVPYAGYTQSEFHLKLSTNDTQNRLTRSDVQRHKCDTSTEEDQISSSNVDIKLAPVTKASLSTTTDMCTSCSTANAKETPSDSDYLNHQRMTDDLRLILHKLKQLLISKETQTPHDNNVPAMSSTNTEKTAKTIGQTNTAVERTISPKNKEMTDMKRPPSYQQAKQQSLQNDTRDVDSTNSNLTDRSDVTEIKEVLKGIQEMLPNIFNNVNYKHFNEYEHIPPNPSNSDIEQAHRSITTVGQSDENRFHGDHFEPPLRSLKQPLSRRHRPRVIADDSRQQVTRGDVPINHKLKNRYSDENFSDDDLSAEYRRWKPDEKSKICILQDRKLSDNDQRTTEPTASKKVQRTKSYRDLAKHNISTASCLDDAHSMDNSEMKSVHSQKQRVISPHKSRQRLDVQPNEQTAMCRNRLEVNEEGLDKYGMYVRRPVAQIQQKEMIYTPEPNNKEVTDIDDTPQIINVHKKDVRHLIDNWERSNVCRTKVNVPSPSLDVQRNEQSMNNRTMAHSVIEPNVTQENRQQKEVEIQKSKSDGMAGRNSPPAVKCEVIRGQLDDWRRKRIERFLANKKNVVDKRSSKDLVTKKNSRIVEPRLDDRQHYQRPGIRNTETERGWKIQKSIRTNTKYDRHRGVPSSACARRTSINSDINASEIDSNSNNSVIDITNQTDCALSKQKSVTFRKDDKRPKTEYLKTCAR